MMSLSDHDALDAKVESLASSMRILRTQTSPVSSSSHSSLNGRAGRRPLARITPPNSSSNMFSSGFGGSKTPSFGTFKSTPTSASVAAADNDDDDMSDIITPSQSNLASKLPQMSYAKPNAPVFAPRQMGGMGAIPSFGTSSQSVPSNPTPAPRTVPTFGATSASSAFPSAFAGTPKKMVEVIESSDEPSGAEILGATIQFIGRLRSGEKVYMQEIERTPVEDVVAHNPDFFDIDEKDERVHLLHKDVDPKLLMYEGQQLGEMAGEKKREPVPTPAPEPSRAGTFSRPTPPSFGGPSSSAAPPATDSKPTFGTMSVPNFAKARPPVPSFGAVKVEEKVEEKREEKKEVEKPVAPSRIEPRPVPTFGGPSRAVPSFTASATSNFESPKPLTGMPSFGTKSLELQRPDSALSNRSEGPKKVAALGGTESTRGVCGSSASSTISSGAEDEAPMRKRLSSVDSESFHSSEETMDEKRETIVMDDEVEETNPYAFHSHPDLRSLCKKSSIALDSVRNGEIHQASVISSFSPNRIVLAMTEENKMDNLHAIMNDLRRSYVDMEPLGDGVRLGQFAVAINGDCIVRVVVLRKVDLDESKKAYECACLDFNALISVEGDHLYELLEKYNVTAIRATTFIARINRIADLTERGHKAMKLVVKGEAEDDSIKKRSPFVFHGTDKNGDLVVDVAVIIAAKCVWLGESLPQMIGDKTMIDCNDTINPNIEHAMEFALKHQMDGYALKKREEKVEKKTEEESYDRADTPNESDLTTIRCDSQEKVQDRKADSGVSCTDKEETPVLPNKEEGELDSSLDDSFTSERTTVDRHAAGDFVRDVKTEMPDEFVVVAPVAPDAILNVESMTKLIRLLNKKGEDVDVAVIKSMCRALILTANKFLCSEGERGALIANAEALEEIDMA